jgi:hypothetical protein
MAFPRIEQQVTFVTRNGALANEIAQADRRQIMQVLANGIAALKYPSGVT